MKKSLIVISCMLAFGALCAFPKGADALTLTPPATRRRTKIVATIGPVSRNVPILERLVEAGMDVARINLSHGSIAEHERGIVAGTRKGVERAPFLLCQLRDDVCGRAEAINAQPARVAGQPQSAVADQAGAQQRRQRRGIAIGQREAVARVGDSEFGVTAVDLITGEARRIAQIFAAAHAEAALAASPAEPGYTDALTNAETGDAVAQHGDPSDDFMAGNDRQARLRQFTVREVQIGAADAAGFDGNQQLAATGVRYRQFDQAQRNSGTVQEHGLHATLHHPVSNKVHSLIS